MDNGFSNNDQAHKHILSDSDKYEQTIIDIKGVW